MGDRVDHTLKAALARRGRTPHPREYTMRYPIYLAPLPVHAKLSTAERERAIQAMIDEIEAEHAGRQFLGAAAVPAQDPDAAPADPKQSRAPAVHTTSRRLRSVYLQLRASFRAAYRGAARAHAYVPTVVTTWPEEAYLPARQYLVRYRSEGILCARRIVEQTSSIMQMVSEHVMRPG